ncbi:HotDog domain-containing protein [Phascolomyces articulosus]|uniref:HotDog domain-containing protein n=1 Tax=Phascolomyces articulosus TaxID=60185 RepID=A0AAD5KLJ9_9FUNG|nr:HotDog domain-containing protein [Phascolomyces articulosus]
MHRTLTYIHYFSYNNPAIHDRLYSVLPNRFWIDKVMERENQKPIDESHPQKPRQLIEKTMADSYMEMNLPFKSSPALLEEYIFVDGRIRTGKLLEDLDAMAGAIAYKHVDNGDPDAPPVTIVTACVDRLDLLLPNAVEDYKLIGQVTYVGTSSMEVFLKAEIIPDGESEQSSLSATESPKPSPEALGHLGPNTILATRFTMVAIDSVTRKPAKINPLKTETPAEERLFEFAKANKARKKRESETTLSRHPPTQEERLAIHDIYLQYSQYKGAEQDPMTNPEDKKPLPKEFIWMEDTRIDSNFLMQPQDRNIHNNIFGGYLMRRAYELAYANSTLYLKSQHADLLAMDEVIFRKPVHVGSLLNLKSEIIYSEGHPHRSFQCRVVAEVVDIEKDTRETTNVFYFTMAATDEKTEPRRILPKTYAETMLWLDGKRRRLQGVSSRHLLLEQLAKEK